MGGDIGFICVGLVIKGGEGGNCEAASVRFRNSRLKFVSQSVPFFRVLESSSSSSARVRSEAYLEGKIRERGGRRGGDGSRELAVDLTLGGGVGRAPMELTAKKSAVAERVGKLSFGFDTTAIVSLRKGGGGGVGIGGPAAANELKKAAVLLPPLEDDSRGDGKGDGSSPSATLDV